jgi:hypothetical protein
MDRILVIEDEANIADYLMTGLREEGSAVEHAADGLVGWDRLQDQARDLVLLDWWLPVKPARRSSADSAGGTGGRQPAHPGSGGPRSTRPPPLSQHEPDMVIPPRRGTGPRRRGSRPR